MNIDRISANKVMSIYGKSKRVNVKKVDEQKRDTLEISSLGRAMSDYVLNMKSIHSDENVKKIRTEVKNGTYNRNSKLVAKKMFDIMQGNEI
ncbi:hypothetical protein CLTEP_12590 [Clostridium tepidiprofundi DSM 19306]|uniref:Anti-sigma-28 factor FlgM C-terminal domain-containing protein n=1 Tax=Clostridium tepidiprofundi DSM 19306 TaxID=1121338 RepID=A0A151B4F0_9CLOT|nr:flagellar biosynthesis anti-sigma factor FlgM [Clostridium tepidiprofundi]KYH34794.1 hypothetical protein CLTEP_12590 [Clostridium tepidiprofundi DSM 19306]